MIADRPVVRAMLRLVLLGGGALAGYLLLSLFGGPAQAQPGDEDASLLGGVSTTVSTVTDTVDDSEPVDRVVEETAVVDLGSPVSELTDQVEETVATTLDTTGQVVEPEVEPVVETAAPTVETPAVDETAAPLDPVVESGDAAGAAPDTTAAPATVSQSGGNQPAGAERESTAESASDPAQPEPAAVAASVAITRSPVPVLDFDVVAQAVDPLPHVHYPGLVPTRVPQPATGQAAAGAVDPSPPSPTAPPETRLPDASSGRTLLSEDVTGSGLVMPVSAPPG